MLPPPFGWSKIGGGELVCSELELPDGVPRPNPRIRPPAPDEAALPTLLCIDRSSTERSIGEKAFRVGGVAAANCSCSCFVARRMSTVRASSVTVADTWLAAASSKLTGDMPELDACVLTAATRLLSVASKRSDKALSVSGSTSERSRELRRSKARLSSIIAEAALTTAFIGESTRVGAFERPAVSKLSTELRKAVIGMSRIPPSAVTGSSSADLSTLGACE